MPPDRTISGRNAAAIAGGVLGLAVAAAVGVALASSSSVRAILIPVMVAAVGLTVWGAVRARAELATRAHRLVSDRRTLQEETAALSEALGAREAVLAGMGEGVVLFAPDGRAVYANPAARTLLGRRFDTETELTPGILKEAVLAARTAGEPERGSDPPLVEFETADATVQAAVVPAEPPGTVLSWRGT